ncbi:RICIN domain-containing protein [Embleya sp. NPDC056575]|uniref:RICIN domain-containing protein n=1 Tax=unclassified Embleya TaxID=2699296 RepID=UPI0036B7C391
MRKSRVTGALGAVVLAVGVLPATAHAAQGAESHSAVSCKQNHPYTFSVPGGPGSSSVYLNVGGGSRKGAKVITWPWAGGQGNEKWCLTPGPRGYAYNLRPWDNRNLCLDVPAGKYREGQELIVWTCNNGKNQDFYVQPVSTDGGTYHYTVLGPWEASHLKIHRGQYGQGSPVSLWKHLNMNAQWH